MTPAVFAFRGHRLDIGMRQLFRGSVELHLSPKAFDLLVLLLEHRERAMSKAELHEQLWPDTFVTEANLASLVAELRRVFSDPPSTPRFVRTVHRFGYAFCAEIEADRLPPPQASTCWVIWNGRELPLHDGENIIGRDETAAIRIDAPSVSRRHARIVVSANTATIEDLGSKNGTLAQGASFLGPRALSDLDEIQVGSVRVIVRIMRSSAPTATVDVR